MTREQDFRHFYKSDLIQSLNFTEKERKGIVTKIFVSIALFIVFIPVCIVLWRTLYNELFLIPAMGLLFGVPIYINRLFGDTLFYKNFKRKIIGKIIKYINPSLDYDNLQKVDDVEYDNAKFFENDNTLLYGDDHVSGVLNDVRFEFSELLAEFKNESDKKEAATKFQFRGLFMLAEFKKDFSAEFLIKTATLPLSNATPYGSDESFNRLFKVKILKNPENIDKVLTSSVINQIKLLRERIDNDFMVSFADNRIYIGIVHDEDLFEPTLFQSMMNYDKIKGYFDDLFYPVIFIEEVTKEISN